MSRRKQQKEQPKLSPGTAVRITMKRGLISKKLLVTEGVVPRIGDEITLEGVSWFVTKLKEEKVLAVFRPEGRKLTQVFP